MSTFTKTISKGSGCLPLMFLVMSLPFMGIGGYQSYKEIMLKAHGEIVSATVVGKEYTTGRNGGSCHVIYEFKTEAGITIKDKSQVTCDNWNKLEKDMGMSVLYNPENPTNSRAASDSYFVFMLVFFAVGALFFSIAATCFAVVFKREKNKEYLASNGLSIKGVVVSVDYAGKLQNKPMSILTYSFISPIDGAEIKGKSDWMAEGKLAHFKAGDEINITYNPNNPKQHIWKDEDQYNGSTKST